jgi:hypothetical protein
MNTQNTPTSQDIQDLIQKWISENRMFTKYDVTKQLRHNGFWVDHSEIKSEFSRASIPNTYNIVALNTNGNPLLFHPDRTDPVDYDPYEIPMFKVTRKTNVSGNTTVKMSTPNSSDFFDNRGRFTITAKDVRSAGFKPGAVLRISANTGCIEIDNTDGKGRRSTVDCYFNIRVPKKEFENAFDNIPSKIKVKISSNKIEIVEG